MSVAGFGVYKSPEAMMFGGSESECGEDYSVLKGKRLDVFADGG